MCLPVLAFVRKRNKEKEKSEGVSQKMGGKEKKKCRVEQEKRGQGIVWRSDLAAQGLKSLNLICEENVSRVSTAGMSKDKTHWTNLQRGMYKTLSLLATC